MDHQGIEHGPVYEIVWAELVHFRQLTKMIYKRMVKPSHLRTQQMVTTDDTKPITSCGQKESTTLHSII